MQDEENYHIQQIGGIPFRLKAPFDLDFIRRYGSVFKVFDNQDSGNLCFGMRDGGKRCFVKFAGAPPCVSRRPGGRRRPAEGRGADLSGA